MNLRAAPAVAPRALGLIRVSKERSGMVSPEVQRVAIEDYAASRGYVVAGWLEGLDQSGSRARSAWWPRLDQAIASIEAGDYDVIVVWRYSRVARNRLRWAVAVDRIEAAGGRIESATEQVDTSTSTGRFARGMLAELQAFEAERMGDGWREVHARRVAAGLPANGKPRFGYVYDLAAKIHRPDPVIGPLLAEAYHRYVSGESMYSLASWMRSRGVRTTRGGLMSDRTLRRVMDSGFAAGLITANGHRSPGVHEALIDAETWQAYQDGRAVRTARPARVERSQYLLSGMLRCARCGGALAAGQFGESGQPKYRCVRGRELGPEVCRGGYVMASFVEREVLAWVASLSGEVESAAAALGAGARQVSIEVESGRLAREVARAEEALARLAVQNAEAPLPESVFRRARGDLVERIEVARAALGELGRARRRAEVNPEAVVARLSDDWDVLPVAVRRELLRSLIGVVLVRTGRPRALVMIVPAWECRG